MAAERRGKFDKLQVSLLCDEDADGMALPKVAIEALVDEFDLHQRVYVIDDQTIFPHAFDLATHKWASTTQIDYLNSRREYLDIIVLTNGDVMVVYSDSTYLKIMTEKKSRIKLRSFGDADPAPEHRLRRFDERPELHAVVRLHDDVYALFDDVFMANYMEVDFKTDKILKLEKHDYRSDKRSERPHWNRFPFIFSRYNDLGGGKCLLEADPYDPAPHTKVYVLIDVLTRKYEEIPNPYPDNPARNNDHYVGIQNGDIFTVGGLIAQTHGYTLGTTRCSRFDMATKKWHRLADTPAEFWNMCMTCLPSGDIMVLRSNSSDQDETHPDEMAIYSVNDNTWTVSDAPFKVYDYRTKLVLI
jgi:hypothetical protein